MIYILRHGLDDENFIGGWSDVELTSEGIAQVKRTIEFMKAHQITFDRIYSSDVKRAKQTSELVAREYHVPILFCPCLRELDKGLLTGLLKEEAEQKYPNYIENVGVDVKYPNGESLRDLYQRQREIIKWLFELKQSLIVTHRGPINMYYFYLQNEALTNDKKRFDVTHASLHMLDIKQKTLTKIFDPKEEK